MISIEPQIDVVDKVEGLVLHVVLDRLCQVFDHELSRFVYVLWLSVVVALLLNMEQVGLLGENQIKWCPCTKYNSVTHVVFLLFVERLELLLGVELREYSLVLKNLEGAHA